jgi:hypothetical protein
MYCIEMLIEDGSWAVKRHGNLKRCAACRPDSKSGVHLHHADYEYRPGRGQWVPVGGLFSTPEEAQEKIAQYVLCGSWKKPKEFRVVPAG